MTNKGAGSFHPHARPGIESLAPDAGLAQHQLGKLGATQQMEVLSACLIFVRKEGGEGKEKKPKGK